MSAEAAAGEHRLDFVVMGTARSGTSALLDAINLDPGICCGTEYFAAIATIDYSTLTMPDAFFNPAHKAGDAVNTERTLNMLRAKLEAGQVTAFGNKHPSYFLIMERLYRQLPALRGVSLYRTPVEVAASSDKRAGNPKDPWDEGRTGIFGIVEWMIGLSRLAETRTPLRIVDYASVFYRDAALLPQVLEYVSGRAPGPDVRAALQTNVYRGPSRARPPIQDSPYDAILRRIGASELDDIIGRKGFFPVSDASAELQGFVNQAMGQVFDHAATTLVTRGTPAEKRFVFRWSNIMARAFDDPDCGTYRQLGALINQLIERLLPEADDEMREQGRRVVGLVKTRQQQPAVALK